MRCSMKGAGPAGSRPPRRKCYAGGMELTPEQIAAAKASGCAFLPATDEQVARLTMQRRIFTIAGEPHVATRNDGAVKETHGAIAMLIAGEAPRVEETAQQAVAADAEAALEMAGEIGCRPRRRPGRPAWRQRCGPAARALAQHQAGLRLPVLTPALHRPRRFRMAGFRPR